MGTAESGCRHLLRPFRGGGELKFKDVVSSLGAESAFAAFEEERKQIQAAIDAVVLAVDALETKMSELRSLERTKAILADFR